MSRSSHGSVSAVIKHTINTNPSSLLLFRDPHWKPPFRQFLPPSWHPLHAVISITPCIRTLLRKKEHDGMAWPAPLSSSTPLSPRNEQAWMITYSQNFTYHAFLVHTTEPLSYSYPCSPLSPQISQPSFYSLPLDSVLTTPYEHLSSAYPSL